MISSIRGKLEDRAYRTAFVASQINIGIPFQIKALMKARGWTQEQLAERTGMLQPRISAILKPGKVRPNIETLRRLAEAFDCGLLVRFAPFSELAKWSESFDPEKFNVPPFEDDSSAKEEQRPHEDVAASQPGLGSLKNFLAGNIAPEILTQIHAGALTAIREIALSQEKDPSLLQGFGAVYKASISQPLGPPIEQSSAPMAVAPPTIAQPQIAYRNSGAMSQWTLLNKPIGSEHFDYTTTQVRSGKAAA